MSASAPTQRHDWALRDFIAWENAQDERHEFIAGRIVAMTGARAGHNRYVTRLTTAIDRQLKTPCEVYSHVMRVVVAEQSFYPDIVVSCASIDDEVTELNDAVFIIEVTSPSTRRKDETVKVDAYLTLPSLESYAIASPDGVRLYTRGDRAPWQETDYPNFDHITLPLGLALTNETQ